MKQTLVSESELKDRISEIYEEERLQIINEKWAELSIKDKKFVLEFLKEINPGKAKTISESKWYNTLGDIAGIFDPTGIIDVINGISYWRQGDKLFAVLSWVSAIPYLGDVIAKPVVGVMKVGGKLPKLFKAAAVAGDATKMGKIAKSVGGPIGKLVEKAPVWGDKLIMMLKNSVGRVPGLGKGLVKTIEEYVNIFKGASVEMKASQKITKKLASKQLKNPLTTAEKELLAKELKKQSQFRGFRDYKGEGQSFMAKYLSGGMGRLWGNRATRSLMRRTKWYLGLLDFLGLANFVGPDELEKQYPDIENKIEQYNQTPNAQTYAQQEFGSMVGTTSQSPETSQPSAPQQKSSGMDAISALGSLLSGGVGSKLVGI